MLGWSQDQLAQAAHVAKATIASFEAGKREPYDRTLAELRRTLEVAGAQFVDQNGGGAGVRLQNWPFMLEEISDTAVRVRHTVSGDRFAFGIINKKLVGAAKTGEADVRLTNEARDWAAGVAQSLYFT